LALQRRRCVMDDLIEALTIFRKYRNEKYPTHCEHDVMYIMAVTQDEVSTEDRSRLDVLGFRYGSEADCWYSFRYGSA
jgi:hypothetical protein